MHETVCSVCVGKESVDFCNVSCEQHRFGNFHVVYYFRALIFHVKIFSWSRIPMKFFDGTKSILHFQV